MIHEELNEREKLILKSIIQQFILTATPVGSRFISKKYEIGFSPATIRNVMADLEESGYIDHPHTSAGRIPTDKGYRYYVDALMPQPKLNELEKKSIEDKLKNISNDPDELIKVASNILSQVTRQIACVSYPALDDAVLNKIQLIEITSKRLLVVISVTSGLIKTVTLEMDSEINSSVLESVESKLNEKLCGLTFKQIKSTFSERFKDVENDEKPIIRLFLEYANKVFSDTIKDDRIIMTGAKNILHQPEFEDPEKFESIIELIENKDVVIHILEQHKEETKDSVIVKIGKENLHEKFYEYSLVTKEYNIGEVKGILGIIGPKRMEYSKIISIVGFISETLSNFLGAQNR
ncbi:MAG: heat-inducible transcriptional repressor HrcA [Ignavibacterium sp.]|nr:heat-inducible transcriptional repressor HrcA [Ignavibacterium sp.]MCX7612482.1 heat-inducible transcriptional repressor HrcA [Ignavibacterium sp.]MDW8374862.1 heat-inducible transcriptional repressor HrcA [Ignavibacteriales bacterium]